MQTLQTTVPLPRKFLVSLASAALLLSLTASNNCFAGDTTINSDELVTILRATKVVPAESKLTASISGDEVVVTTTKKEGASNDAVKIQAVLIAKTVFESVNNDAQRTKVIMFDFGNDAWSEVSVKRAEVKMYGAGQLTEKELLSSLELKQGKGDSGIGESSKTFKVAPGPMDAERVLLRGRLETLEQAGSNVKDLWQQFEQLEEIARSGDLSQIRDKIAAISDAAKAREKAFRDAQHRQAILDNRVTSQAARRLASGDLSAQFGTAGLQKTNGQHGDGNGFFPNVSDLMVGPSGKNMYSFEARDVPSYQADQTAHRQIMRFLKAIQEGARKGQDVKDGVSYLNAAVAAVRQRDGHAYDSAIAKLKQRFPLFKPAQ